MSKKAEKRLAQRALRSAKRLGKSARQFADPLLSRSVSEDIQIDPQKIIPETKLPAYRQLMRWDRDTEDAEGEWSWGAKRQCCVEDWDGVVHPFFKEYEKKRWVEIDSERTGKGKKRRKKHIHYPFDRLIDEAYRRLIDLKLDDFAPNIFRFRLSGLKRLFGFRIAATATFHMVWFDPEHRLYKQLLS